VRGVPTPNIDRIAAEGVRLTNFNVEYSCTVSRAALLTGRYASRAGASQPTGMTLWEITLAEALKRKGYATALYGKWHLGGNAWQRRQPTDQGFDEWYGIPRTSNEAQATSFENFDSKTMETPSIWQGKAGEESKRVKVFDLDTRRTIDRECAERGIAFMKRSVERKQPFFLYYPMTQLHFPTLPHPDFSGKTGAGDMGDSMADVDYNVGLVLQAIDDLGIRTSTIVIWCTDNGAEARRPWRGSPGPWRGYYNSALEGGIRTPCVIRWPDHIPAGLVSNEIVHELDLFPTLAAAVGDSAMVPQDRPIDGVNQLPFLKGEQAHSNRTSALFFGSGDRLLAVKWKDWKIWYDYTPWATDTDQTSAMRLFHLRSDPTEDTDLKDYEPWVISVADKIVADYNASVTRFPNVPTGAKDPYEPPRPRD
jgi:arylsulfatase